MPFHPGPADAVRKETDSSRSRSPDYAQSGSANFCSSQLRALSEAYAGQDTHEKFVVA